MTVLLDGKLVWINCSPKKWKECGNTGNCKIHMEKNTVPGYTVICPYPGCPVSLYPGLQTHSNDSGTSTQFCVVLLQLCRPLRHSFSKGHRVEAHTRDTWLVAFLPSHVSSKGPLKEEQHSKQKETFKWDLTVNSGTEIITISTHLYKYCLHKTTQNLRYHRLRLNETKR